VSALIHFGAASSHEYTSANALMYITNNGSEEYTQHRISTITRKRGNDDIAYYIDLRYYNDGSIKFYGLRQVTQNEGQVKIKEDFSETSRILPYVGLDGKSVLEVTDQLFVEIDYDILSCQRLDFAEDHSF
jgi:hypothetical protein